MVLSSLFFSSLLFSSQACLFNLPILQVSHFKTQLCFSCPLVIQTGVGAPGGGGEQGEGLCPCRGCGVWAAGSRETGRPGALRVSGNKQPSAVWLDGAFVRTHTHTHTHTLTGLRTQAYKQGWHTHPHKYTHLSAQSCMHTFFCSFWLSLSLSLTHTHTYTHKNTHRYTHMHT